MVINLCEISGSDHPFGNVIGRATFSKLIEIVDSNPGELVFDVSLEGIVATDSSFPRESVISIAKQLRGEKWFYISHIESSDLLDNWDYAAKAKKQWLIVFVSDGHKVIGPEMNSSTREMLDFVLLRKSVGTSEVAKNLGLSVQNASTRLKRLVNEGLIMRREETSPSGGKEFVYESPK